MACVASIPTANADSEMEEGEIVDEFDDISSDEELLLRQRLHVLETYNNVLERKKAKDFSIAPGDRERFDLSRDLSEISASDLEDSAPQMQRNIKHKRFKSHHRQKRRKEVIIPKNSVSNKIHKKKVKQHKKTLEIKIISESSEESDDEYRNKRRKLANAVSLNKGKSDTSSLSARLKKMLNGAQEIKSTDYISSQDKQTETKVTLKSNDISNIIQTTPDENCQHKQNNNSSDVCELIDLCNDDDVKIINNNCEPTQDTVDSIITSKINDINGKSKQSDSDEDLELLRQHVLKTKSSKLKVHQDVPNDENKPIILSEDDENYTAQLRLICLKSAYLKKAFEIKRKHKLKKRLSQSSTLPDDIITDQNTLSSKVDSQNNTDIESVDMEIGSDGDEKIKEFGSERVKDSLVDDGNLISSKDIAIDKHAEELEEDEDLLRAKLLTSLSKNLPNLIDSTILDTVNEVTYKDKLQPIENKKPSNKVQAPKKFIIELGESDSEDEATKNLTKLHSDLQQQTESQQHHTDTNQQQIGFEQKLDMLLKSTRMKVEKQQLMNDEQPIIQPIEKFVPKSVKHLPKSKQIEYKNLVKKMAELEKIKQARLASTNAMNKSLVHLKETLKPRNVAVETKISANNLDDQIAVSRKKIAEESANMNRLKEEGIKLSRKYKIVATELKNIATAIATNKKQQRFVQTRLTKIRSQHQMLIKSLPYSNTQSNSFMRSMNHTINKIITMTKLQKENDPSKEEHKNPNMLKAMKISVVNDLKEDTVPNPRISIQVDVTNNNTKVVKAKSPVKDKNIESLKDKSINNIKDVNSNSDSIYLKGTDGPIFEKGGGKRRNSEGAVRAAHNIGNKKKRNDVSDYKSPLEALDTANWEEDPNAVLCPFEVGGNCKDPDCKYLHPKTPSIQ